MLRLLWLLLLVEEVVLERGVGVAKVVAKSSNETVGVRSDEVCREGKIAEGGSV